MQPANSLVQMHMQHILTEASKLYCHPETMYVNLMMALPDAFNVWAEERRTYEQQWGTPTDEVESEINWMKHEILQAFQLPVNFIK